MSNYSNYKKSYIQTTRSYYDGDRRNLSIDRIRDDFTNTGVPYAILQKKSRPYIGYPQGMKKGKS